jgi:galactokinase
MNAFRKDVLIRDVLKDNYDEIKEQIDKRRELSRRLMCMPQSAIRDLAVLFMLDLSKSDAERLENILEIMQKLHISMELKIEFLDSYK